MSELFTFCMHSLFPCFLVIVLNDIRCVECLQPTFCWANIAIPCCCKLTSFTICMHMYAVFEWWKLHMGVWNTIRSAGTWFNIKMSSYQYRKIHCGDKTALRQSNYYNGISYSGKIASVYWTNPMLDTAEWLSHYLCHGWFESISHHDIHARIHTVLHINMILIYLVDNNIVSIYCSKNNHSFYVDLISWKEYNPFYCIPFLLEVFLVFPITYQLYILP